MLLYERTEKKLEIALNFIKNLRKYAKEKEKTKLINSIDKCLAKIKEI